MELLAGAFFISIALLMLLLISLFSQAFPEDVWIGDEEVLRGFFNLDSLIYPIIAIIIGVCFIACYFIKRRR